MCECVCVCVCVKYGIGLNFILEMKKCRTGSKSAGCWKDPCTKQIQRQWEPATMGDQEKGQRKQDAWCSPLHMGFKPTAHEFWRQRASWPLGYRINCNLVPVCFITSTVCAIKKNLLYTMIYIKILSKKTPRNFGKWLISLHEETNLSEVVISRLNGVGWALLPGVAVPHFTVAQE